MDASCQALDTDPSTLAPTMCPPCMSQSSTSPVLVLRQSRSLVSLPLKSPLPASCQAPDTEPKAVPPFIFPLFMNQVSTSPVLALRQSRSLDPSPLKSCARM